MGVRRLRSIHRAEKRKLGRFGLGFDVDIRNKGYRK
jgi:hypothetical protein